MRLVQNCIRFSLAGLFVLLAVAEVAWTQATSPAAAPENSAGSGLFAFVFVIGLLALTGIAAKLYDMKRKREDEGVALQARLSDALLTEPSLAHLPITPTVHVPFGPRAQAVIILTGTVPTPALREAVLRLVIREATFPRGSYRLEDRLFVDTLMSRRAA
jgi:hypothetical protein